jgi:hypothetical protein
MQMMKYNLLFLAFAVLLFSGCHRTTLEDLAAKTAEEYTDRYCPTPVENGQRTDSVTFSRETHTFGYYYSLSGKVDDASIIQSNKQQIISTILSSLKENTSMKDYKQAGYSFRYVMKSSKTGDVLIDKTFTNKDYK